MHSLLSLVVLATITSSSNAITLDQFLINNNKVGGGTIQEQQQVRCSNKCSSPNRLLPIPLQMNGLQSTLKYTQCWKDEVGLEVNNYNMCGLQVGQEILSEMDKHPCKDSIHKYCGKEIDHLTDAVKITEIIGTVQAAVDVVACLVQHVDNIWKDCNPFEAAGDLDCHTKYDLTCPAGPVDTIQNDPVAFIGEHVSRVRCAATSDVLGEQCSKQALQFARQDFDSYFDSDDKHPCKDKLKKECGKEIDELNKALDDTAVLATIQASVHLANCVVKNIKDISSACSHKSPSKPPSTKPPSKKPPTPKPTPKPSKKPSETIISEFVTQALGHESQTCVEMAERACATELALSSVLSTEVLVGDEETEQVLDTASDFMLQMCLRANMDRVLRSCDSSSSYFTSRVSTTSNVANVQPKPMLRASTAFFMVRRPQPRPLLISGEPQPFDDQDFDDFDEFVGDNSGSDDDDDEDVVDAWGHHHHRRHHHWCKNPWDPDFVNLPPCPRHHHCHHHHGHGFAAVVLGSIAAIGVFFHMKNRRRALAALAAGKGEDKKKCHGRRCCCDGKDDTVVAKPAVAGAVVVVANQSDDEKEGYVPLMEPHA